MNHGLIKTIGRSALALGACLLGTSAHAQCARWDVSGQAVVLRQSHGGFTDFDLVLDGQNVSGTARTTRSQVTNVLNLLWQGEEFNSSGTVDGVFDGTRLELRVKWADLKTGIYEISIDQYGRVTGSTYEFERPASRANVMGFRRLECADVAPPPPPPPPPPPKIVTQRDVVTDRIVDNNTRSVEPARRVTRAIGKRPVGPIAGAGRAIDGISGARAAQCIAGYVRRRAGPSDAVCVTPASQTRVAAENANAAARWVPGGAYGPKTCATGFVWREAFDGDQVCVVPGVRDLTRTENRLAASRVVP